ncbi:hypothetical protein BGY98DRAFT_626769 [Russula aff. rugulosa BPL654]|nr:hypothetical protein BGY98DRAFT_626769 [Russula aff. rugulosa BPL654]
MPSCPAFIDWRNKNCQCYHHCPQLPPMPPASVTALRRLPLCNPDGPGHHTNDERRHLARCQQTAQDPLDSPLPHHRPSPPLTVDNSRMTALVLSTVTVALHQLIKFVIDKVVQDHHIANELESITLADETTQVLCPAGAMRRYLRGPLSVGYGERPQFLQLEYLHKTFALEPRADRERTQLPPVLPRASRALTHIATPPLPFPCSPKRSPTALRFPACPPRHPSCLPRAQCSSDSPASSRQRPKSSHYSIKLIHDETEPGEPQPGWKRLLAMEIMYGLRSDAEFMH